MNELQKTENLAFALPKTYTEAKELAKDFAKSGMVPKHYENKPEAIVVAWDLGLNLGLGLTQSLQSIYVVNGMPTVWGDGALALVRSSGLMEFIDESVAGQCTIKRKGEKPVTVYFSMDEAKKANLTTKPIWTQYPARMLKMRNRAFALRDVFPDVLKGLAIKEEVDDYIDPYPNAIDTKGSNTVKSALADIKESDQVPEVGTITETDQTTGEIKVIESERSEIKLSLDEMNEALELFVEIKKMHAEKDIILKKNCKPDDLAKINMLVENNFTGNDIEQIRRWRDFFVNLK